MTNLHLTDEQLQMLVDNEIPVHEATALREHVDLCARCQALYETIAGFDHLLAAMPGEKLSPGFTRQVLANLKILPKQSIFFRIIENLGYVFGLMIVIGILLSAFIVTGVVKKDQLLLTESAIGETVTQLTTQMGSAFRTLTTSLKTYLPFIFGNESLKTAIMGIMILGMLALVDRIMRKRMDSRSV